MGVNVQSVLGNFQLENHFFYTETYYHFMNNCSEIIGLSLIFSIKRAVICELFCG